MPPSRPSHDRRSVCGWGLAVLLFAMACGGEHTPVLPTDPGGETPPGALTVTVTSDRTSLEATATTPATLTVSARAANGTAAPDGTSVTINTNLGGFGTGDDGKPIQLVTRVLAGGVATVQFFAGDTTGTANILAQAGTSVGRFNLPIVQPAPMPAADFAFEASGLSVLFTDASTGAPATRTWQFGDGETSDAVSPRHEYKAAGTYTVILTVRNTSGESSKSKFVTVALGPPLVASFTADVNGRAVFFTDTSSGTPVKWSWEFGDGATESPGQRNASHTYASPGTFGVKLTVENQFGVQSIATQFVTLDPAPAPNFTYAVNGFQVIFTDTSTANPTAWSWDFGDCNNDPPPSTPCTDLRQNTAHTYEKAGTYNVVLTVFNASGSASKNQLVTVPVGTAPTANFTVQTNGLNANFTDTSTGNPTSWLWDFGDCAINPGACTDTAQSPQHTYTTGDTYNVTLTATNAIGSSKKSTFVTVPASVPPVAAFGFLADGLSVHFTDQSTGSPTTYLWNFGDGTNPSNRTQPNPVHPYSQPGTYTVTLQVSNLAGSSSASKAVPTPPVAKFTFSTAALQVTFTDQSGNATAWQWDFGDCPAANCTSTVRNPVHTYAAAGTYTVNLTATNGVGASSTSRVVTLP
jgi:PKD repeat protein